MPKQRYIDIVCETCKTRCERTSGNQKHCVLCRHAHYASTRPCKLCGKPLSLNRKPNHGVCAKCIFGYFRTIGKRIGFQSGDRNHRWSGRNGGGGRRIYDGHIYVRAQKPDGGYFETGEHRIIWERHHETKIPEGWVVHHINGDGMDNRPENLQALPDRTHKYLIPLLQEKIRSLELELANQKKLSRVEVSAPTG